MKRIDTATRAVDLFGAGKDGYKDGDLVNGVAPTDLNAAAMNGPQEEILSVVEAAGLAPNGADFAQLLKALYRVAGTPVGLARNVRADLLAAGSSITFTADEILTKSALGGRPYLISSVNKVLNVATVGAGGMDVGAAPASGWIAIYAIYNPTTATAALLGVNATAAAAPEVYGGANMPADYVTSALISVWPTTAASLLAIARQRVDREVDYFNNPYNGTGNVAFTTLSIAAAVPKNAIRWKGNLSFAPTTTGNISMAVCPTSAGIGTPGYRGFALYSSTGINVGGSLSDVPIYTAQTTFYVTASAGNFTINSYGYTF
jgi:hypothetical protein